MAELSIKLICETGESFFVEKIVSYELSSSVSAPCDGLRLNFTASEPLPVITGVEAYCEGALIFSGLCDTQREENTGQDVKCFIYARSSACILTDNEAEPCTYDAPTARSLFIVNAEKYGFKFSMEDIAFTGKYTVMKGCSCYSAINRLVSSVSGRNVLITPDGRLTLPVTDTVYKADAGDVISCRKIINRGAPLSEIDYKTASDSTYCRHIKSRYFESQGIKRTKKANLSAMFDRERTVELKRMLKEAAKEYEKLEISLTGLHGIKLYDGIDFEGGNAEGYYTSSVLRVLDKNGERTVVTLVKEHDTEEIIYVD